MLLCAVVYYPLRMPGQLQRGLLTVTQHHAMPLRMDMHTRGVHVHALAVAGGLSPSCWGSITLHGPVALNPRPWFRRLCLAG